jgi:hypothetical protein
MMVRMAKGPLTHDAARGRMAGTRRCGLSVRGGDSGPLLCYEMCLKVAHGCKVGAPDGLLGQTQRCLRPREAAP